MTPVQQKWTTDHGHPRLINIYIIGTYTLQYITLLNQGLQPLRPPTTRLKEHDWWRTYRFYRKPMGANSWVPSTLGGRYAATSLGPKGPEVCHRHWERHACFFGRQRVEPCVGGIHLEKPIEQNIQEHVWDPKPGAGWPACANKCLRSCTARSNSRFWLKRGTLEFRANLMVLLSVV